jgi:hypothetical protein
MGKLAVPTLDDLRNTSLGPGIMGEGVVDDSISGLTKFMQGNTAYGRILGHMTSTPELTVAREWVDLTENVVTVTGTLRGAKQVRRVDVEIGVELAELNFENYKLLNPGQAETDWVNGVKAFLTTGTGNAAFDLVSKVVGTAGNSITRVVATPTGSDTVVAVTGTAPNYVVTITPATGATAGDVVDAVNTHTTANDIVRAGLPSTSDGTGAVVAAASASLAGGTAGTRIGSSFQDQAFITDANYVDLSFIMESTNARFNSVLTLFGCLQTGDFNPSFDDDGNISGISATFVAHADLSTYDPTLGTITPAYRWRQLDPVVV